MKVFITVIIFITSEFELIVIYNPLGWPVSVPVRLPVRKQSYLVYDPKGQIVNTAMMKIPTPVVSIPERDTLADHELVFIATDIPPLGLRSYYIERMDKKRVKKSLIKKLKNNRQSKYYILQTNQYPIENQTFFADDDDYDEYYDESATKRVDKIQVGNIPKGNNDKNFSDVLTPKPRKVVVTTDNLKDVTDSITPRTTDNFKDVTDSATPTTTDNFKDVTDSATPTTTDNFKDVTDSTTPKHMYATTENYGFVNRKMIQTNINDYETFTERTIAATRTTTRPTVKRTKPTTISTTIPRTTPTRTTTVLAKVNIQNSTVAEINETEDVLNEDYRKYVHYYEESKDQFIENKHIKISLDPSTHKVGNIVLSNGVNTSLDIQFYYYVSDDPIKMKNEKKPPGAYIFRPMDMSPEPIIDFVDTKVFKSDVVNEIHCRYSDYASFVVKLYEDSPVVEVDWVVGPVAVDDELGKDVFVRYTTDLVNDGVFYTDANGRQTIKRIRHMRATYEPANLDPIAGNIYPVTSRIYIEDLNKNMRLSIFNDRSQGGTCLYDGMVDLIVHRRILTDDIGIQSYLNETIDGQGIIVRGKHYLYLTKANFKPNKVFEKKFAKEIELMPQIFVTKDVPVKDKWLEFKNEVFALKNKLPIGVHILTMEKWNDDTILIRIENFLEKVDVVKHGIKKVFLKDLFLNIKVKSVKETTLAANIWLENWTPLQWNKTNNFFRNFNDYYGNVKLEYSEDEGLKPFEDVVLEDGITLTPQQIRTFVVWYNYIDN